jgi:pyruvate ferredoxin oxidoreductase beta subunit
MPEIYSAAAGLGGRDIRPGHFLGISENMLYDGFKNVAIGVKWPDGLEMSVDPDLRPAGAFSMRVHSAGGFGSDTHRAIASIAAGLFGLEVQASSKYGLERNGEPATYSLTVAPERVRTHCELNAVDLVAIQNPKAISAGNPLAGLRSGGTLYLQSELAPDKVWSSLPVEIQRTVDERRLRLFALNATPIAREMQGMALLGAFLRLTPFREQSELTEKELFQLLENALGKHFGKSGVALGLAVVRRGYFEVVEVQAGALSSSAGNGEPAWRLPGSPGEGNLIPADFCGRIVGSYLHGCEDELEADEFAARGLMPAYSARGRGFLHLARELPVFMADACVGCMECVNQCPDTAILARVVEARQLERSLRKTHPSDLRGELRLHFVVTDKYHDGLFGLFVDPDKCKGCGECVTVCGSHAGLKMAPKGELDIAGYDAGMDLWRDLRETPKRFIRDKSLGDMMLADRSLLYSGGAGSCLGCGEATALRMMLAATGFVYGADKIGIVAASGCHTVFGSTYPFNPFGVPWTNSLSGNAPADAIGIRLRWDQEGHAERRLWVVGGEEALSDLGFQSLSRMLTSGMDIKVLVLNKQVGVERRKDLARIAMMHPNVYVAQTTPGHLNHFYKVVMEANAYTGPAVVIGYTACMPVHGLSADRAAAQAKLAVESRVFPLLTYDPRRGSRIRERLSLRGNPAVTKDWFVNPQSGSAVDFVAFARTEDRLARHFGADGRPDEYLQLAQGDRLENWRHLQELAGLR